jgi:hypothetical protein
LANKKNDNGYKLILANHVSFKLVFNLSVLAHGRWFSPASSTTKTGRHDILVAEKLLKVALNTINQIQSSRQK